MRNLATAFMFAALLAPVPAGAHNLRMGSDFGVFCVRSRLQVDQRRIEELKSAYGDDVCRLDQDPSESGARDKALKLGGVGATCTCD